MRRLFLVPVALCLAVASPLVAKEKNKVKQKSFEPVSMSDSRQYVGRYVGIEDEFWAEVSLGSEGKVHVALYQNGKLVPLQDLTLAGPKLHAIQIDAGGNEQPFEATFGNQVVNNASSFGLRVEGDVRIGDDVVLNRLFYKRAPPAEPSR